MKNLFLLFIVLFAFAQLAISQIAYGFKTGINLSNQNKTATFTQYPGPAKQETKPLLGYQLGAFFKASISSKLTVAAEVNFSLIGSKSKYFTETQILNPDGKTHYYNNKIGYVEIPLVLVYNFDKFYLGLGPSISFKVFSKITNFEGNTYSGFNYRKFDAAANLLLGYKISKKLEVNLRYSYGLVNILEDRFNQETKNRFLNLSLLYFLKSK